MEYNRAYHRKADRTDNQADNKDEQAKQQQKRQRQNRQKLVIGRCKKSRCKLKQLRKISAHGQHINICINHQRRRRTDYPCRNEKKKKPIMYPQLYLHGNYT